MHMIHALTIDVEDYFQVTGFASQIKPAEWDRFDLRVEPSTGRILETLSAANVSATFFVLGWIARRCPSLVRRIAAAGHEIASHGYWHQLVTTQTPAEFRSDVRNSRRLLEDLTGRAVNAYRAPSFSIAPDRTWAFEILCEEGYRIDSSVAAGRRTSCGHLAPSGMPFELKTASGTLIEYPLPTVCWLGRRWPVGGGGYFRLYPYRFTRRALKAIEDAGRPFAVYLHPWEFDPDQPPLRGPLLKRFRHTVNLGRTLPRFRRLLDDFAFGTLTASLNAASASFLQVLQAA